MTWMNLRRRLRRRPARQPQIPADQRCSFCPRLAVVFESRLDDDLKVVRTNRCLDHPPDGFDPDVRCPTCGRTYWPDFLHLDCA